MSEIPPAGEPPKKLPLVVWAAGAILIGALIWALRGLPGGGGSSAGLKKIESKEAFYSYLSSLKGKVVLVNFWATWCGPCRIEIPTFVEVQNRNRKDLVILALSLDQNPDEVLTAFVERMGMNFTVIYGDYALMQGLGQDYGGIQGIPTSILIDRKGNIVGEPHVGVYPPDLLESDLRGLLEKS